MSTLRRGEFDCANRLLTEIGSYGLSDEAIQYIIAELTKKLKNPEEGGMISCGNDAVNKPNS